MQKSDLILEKHWVTQSRCFRLTTTLVFGMGIRDTTLPFCHGISDQIRETKIQRERTMIGHLMNAPTTPFELIVVFQN